VAGRLVPTSPREATHVHHSQFHAAPAVPAVDDLRAVGCGLVPGLLLRVDSHSLCCAAAPLVRLVRDQRLGTVGRDPAGARRAVHPPTRRVRANGLLGEHDDARGPGVLPVCPHRQDHPRRPRRPRRLCPAPQGPPGRVPDPGPGPAGADPVSPGRPDPDRRSRRPGLPARDQCSTGFGGRGGADRGLRRHAARALRAAPSRQGPQACHHAADRGISARTRCGTPR
jgi:hypothetical protein